MARTKPTKKRQQISQASRTIFLTVAVVAMVVGICLSLSWSLIKKIKFNGQVVDDLKSTEKIAKSNIESVKKLREDVELLGSNELLINKRLGQDQQPLSVIYDAMPVTGNSAALTSSLLMLLSQTGVNAEGVFAELTGDDSSSGGGEVTSDGGGGVVTSTGDDGTPKAIGKVSEFSLKLVSPMEGLRDGLVVLERSIRPIHVNALTLEYSNESSTLQVAGVTYFEHKMSIDKSSKTITDEKSTAKKSNTGGKN